MNVSLLYFDGCPNWRVADENLREALQRVGRESLRVQYRQVTSEAHAQAAGFRGSPSLLVNGRDPFPNETSPVGLACRMYRTADGLAGSPSVEQLVEVLR